MRKTRKSHRKSHRKSSRKGGAALDNSRENGSQEKRQRVDYVDLATRLLSEAGIPKGELTKNEQNDLDRWKESRKGLAASAAENREKRGPHTFPRGVHIPTLIHSIYDQLIRERGIDAKNMTREEYLKYKEDFISGITTDPRFVRIAEENQTESHDPRFSFSREGFTQHVSGLGVIGRLEPRSPSGSLFGLSLNKPYQIQKWAVITDENGKMLGKIMDPIKTYTPGQRLVTTVYGLVIKPGYTITNPDGTTLKL